MLRLKVDIIGIPKGTYKTYEELRIKIAKIMMSVCEGKTDDAQWETSTSIPHK